MFRGSMPCGRQERQARADRDVSAFIQGARAHRFNPAPTALEPFVNTSDILGLTQVNTVGPAMALPPPAESFK